MISIIVPIYNVEKYLKECLESIADQTYKNFECILVDDGSTDSSGKIAESFAAQHDNFKVIHKINGGLASARNSGLDVASGDWLFFLDSDDCILPTELEEFEKISVKQPDVDLIQLGYFRGKEFSNNITDITNDYYTIDGEELKNDFLVFSKSNTVVWGKFWKTSVFGKLRFDTNCYVLEDVEYLSKAIKISNKIAISKFDGYFYRITPGSLITQGINLRKLKGSIYAHKKCMTNNYDDKYIYKKVEAWYYSSMFNWLIRSKKDNVPDFLELQNLIYDTIKYEKKHIISNKNLSLKLRIMLIIFIHNNRLFYSLVK